MRNRLTKPVCLTALIAFGVGAAVAEPVSLSANGANAALTVSVELTVGGDLLSAGDAEPHPIEAKATARYRQSARATADNAARRWYDRATLTAGGRTAAELSDASETFVAQLAEGSLRSGSTKRSLTQEEIDLVQLPADPLTVGKLLPESPVSVGDRWELTPGALGALLNLQKVTLCDASAVLTDCTTSHAKFRFAGTVHGVSNGATTEIDLSGVALVDRRAKLISQLNLGLEERRSVGPATPGLDVNAKVTLTCTQASDKQAVDPLPKDGVSITYLAKINGPRDTWSIEAPRGWRVTARTSSTATLTLIEGERKIAEVLLRNLPPSDADKATEFVAEAQRVIESAGGSLAGVYEGALPSGMTTRSVQGHGEQEGRTLVWRHYLIRSAEPGLSLSAAVTLYEPESVADAPRPEQDLLDRLVLAQQAKIAESATNNRR